ncbi:MAG: UDP-N-acetylmuramoyl-L-alanyl-D-glutamate--2,6-diaminopimelate ligase [Akkermansiaceae bacterium]|jgi:UDP-N-acetylmuramoyl-L-alanyl-D-glutamate--2,6-diaminopimelate ligase
MISLPSLLEILPEASELRIEDVPVVSVTDHSARVQEGAVFVAVRGGSADGHDYLDEVMSKNPAAIIAQSKGPADYPGLWIQVPDTRVVLGRLAARFAGDPAAAMVTVGVTGTNGKTTVTHFIHSLFENSMIKAGMIGTIKIHDGKVLRDATHTTPGAVELQSILRSMKDNGCKAVTMETSSHGLEQGRCSGIPFQVGVFLNLTQDHLDYHKTMAAYFGAKKILFDQMAAEGSSGVAVINIDDIAGQKLAAEFKGRLKVTTFGFSPAADFRASDLRPSNRGQVFALEARGKSFLVRLPVVGRFNVMNALAALAAVSSTGVPLRDLVKSIGDTRQTRGRMELLGGERISVFIDYAHTPDALEKACETLYELHPNRLVTVFGCGGDRDRSKRPLMGAAAAKYSNVCIVTSDNPRSEDPEAIIAEIIPGLGKTPHEVIVNRRDAINAAIEASYPGDILLIAGKGHETYQEIKGQRQHFDDREVALRALETKRAVDAAEFLKRQEEREERDKKRGGDFGGDNDNYRE